MGSEMSMGAGAIESSGESEPVLDDAGSEGLAIEQAPERPEHLLEGYDDDAAQARAFHAFHQKYSQHGKPEEVAEWGAWARQAYQNNPQLRAVMDHMLGRGPAPQQPQQQQQPQDPFGYSPEKHQQFWEEVGRNPGKYFVNPQQLQQTQQQIGMALQQMMQRLNMMALEPKLAGLHPTLQNLVRQGNVTFEQAQGLASAMGIKSQTNGAQPAQGKGAGQPKDDKGRFTSTRNNGADGKPDLGPKGNDPASAYQRAKKRAEADFAKKR